MFNSIWAATSKSVSTSETKIKDYQEKKSPFSFSLMNMFEGQNYFTDYTSATFYKFVPEVSYSVPKTKLSIGFDIQLVSKLNQIDNYGHKIDIGQVDVKAFYPIWENRSGTSLSSFAVIEGYAFSTEKGEWERFNNRLYANVTLAQDLGKATFKIYPNIVYFVTNPNYTIGDLYYRGGVDLKASYKLTKSFSVYHTQKYRRNYKYNSYNEFKKEYGIKYYYNKWSVESYVSRYDRDLGRLWSLKEQKNVWVNLNIGLKL